MSNYAKIKKYDIANGPGLRTSIFFCGCPHHCAECFNQELWDPNIGEKYSNITTTEEIYSTINSHIEGISILGGEPLVDYNRKNVGYLCWEFKQKFPDKTVWLWTGYTWEELMKNKDEYLDLLINVDVLIDGRFDISKKDLTLKWRGSSNQRVIDVQKSLRKDEVVLYD